MKGAEGFPTRLPKGGISQHSPVFSKSSTFFYLCFMRLNWGGGRIGWRVNRQYQQNSPHSPALILTFLPLLELPHILVTCFYPEALEKSRTCLCIFQPYPDLPLTVRGCHGLLLTDRVRGPHIPLGQSGKKSFQTPSCIQVPQSCRYRETVPKPVLSGK